MIRYMFIILFLFFLFFLFKHRKLKYPTIYNQDKPILLIAGTHGNESAPCDALSDLLIDLHDFCIIPKFNINAINSNVREIDQDLNRCYPDLHPINKYVLPQINKSRLIIDFHEAWGYYNCSTSSLGQTIYITPLTFSLYSSFFKKLIKILNRNIINICEKWILLTYLPPLEGSLDTYCIQKDIPYVLIEMTGQNDIIDRKTRIYKTKEILYYLIGNANNLHITS